MPNARHSAFPSRGGRGLLPAVLLALVVSTHGLKFQGPSANRRSSASKRNSPTLQLPQFFGGPPSPPSSRPRPRPGGAPRRRGRGRPTDGSPRLPLDQIGPWLRDRRDGRGRRRSSRGLRSRCSCSAARCRRAGRRSASTCPRRAARRARADGALRDDPREREGGVRRPRRRRRQALPDGRQRDARLARPVLELRERGAVGGPLGAHQGAVRRRRPHDRPRRRRDRRARRPRRFRVRRRHAAGRHHSVGRRRRREGADGVAGEGPAARRAGDVGRARGASRRLARGAARVHAAA